ncbi:MAG: threonine-phosphate decarboxylase CobD [Methylococcales bacterium]
MQNSLADIENPKLLHHGGGLWAAAAQYGIPLSDWLDLSTGINANGWKAPLMPENIWQRLPESDDDLTPIAQAYYNTEQVLPVAGSQAAIQVLPMLCKNSRVGVIHPGYAEHAHAWGRCGHQVKPINSAEIDQTISELDILILINPNNPTGTVFDPQQLLDWHHQLALRDGWLIVDEAFIDCTPERSLATYSQRSGLVILRSLGKFFGLAGARVGFVCAQAELLSSLNALLGPWTISSASRWLASTALKDQVWQQTTRLRLLEDSQRMQSLLSNYDLVPNGGCALFQWSQTSQAAMLHEHLAKLGILTRLFSQPSSLRFGIPGNQADWQRLETTLARVTEKASF